MAAGARGTDLVLTTGGASVGDHDLVRSVLGEVGTGGRFLAHRDAPRESR